MLRFSLLGSGSDGNAAFVCSDQAKILIDNGLSYKQLEARAACIGASLEGLDAIFVTHEHGDHVAGIGTLARKLNIPVFMTRGTFEQLPDRVGKLPQVHLIRTDEKVPVKDLCVESFAVEHDASEPVSFTISTPQTKLGFATDVGKVVNLVRYKLALCHALVLESNYCPRMLLGVDQHLVEKPYPFQIRQRIAGNRGHLSNDDMCALLKAVLHDALKVVVLVHISQNNNSPERALEGARRILQGRRTLLHLARQAEPTELFEVCA